jgi:hypothetical protein
MFNIISHERNEKQNQNEIPYLPTRMGTRKDNSKFNNDVEKLEPLYTADGNAKLFRHVGKLSCSSLKG